MNYSNNSAYSPSSFLYKVFGFMSLGLGTSAGVAAYLAQSGHFLMLLKTNPWILFVLVLAQLAIVVILSAFLSTLSYAMAVFAFFAYAVLNGMMLSTVFLVYTMSSIATTLAVTACMFLGMAIYGYVTKSDLSGMGNLLIMMLWGIILSMLINMFVGSSSFDYLISGAAVIIFTLLTAVDVQKIKQLSLSLQIDQQQPQKIVILGALILYLDFINLFLNLLRFMGRRRD